MFRKFRTGRAMVTLGTACQSKPLRGTSSASACPLPPRKMICRDADACAPGCTDSSIPIAQIQHRCCKPQRCSMADVHYMGPPNALANVTPAMFRGHPAVPARSEIMHSCHCIPHPGNAALKLRYGQLAAVNGCSCSHIAPAHLGLPLPVPWRSQELATLALARHRTQTRTCLPCTVCFDIDAVCKCQRARPVSGLVCFDARHVLALVYTLAAS
jgi:hypothetical protein